MKNQRLIVNVFRAMAVIFVAAILMSGTCIFIGRPVEDMVSTQEIEEINRKVQKRQPISEGELQIYLYQGDAYTPTVRDLWFYVTNGYKDEALNILKGRLEIFKHVYLQPFTVTAEPGVGWYVASEGATNILYNLTCPVDNYHLTISGTDYVLYPSYYCYGTWNGARLTAEFNALDGYCPSSALSAYIPSGSSYSVITQSVCENYTVEGATWTRGRRILDSGGWEDSTGYKLYFYKEGSGHSVLTNVKVWAYGYIEMANELLCEDDMWVDGVCTSNASVKLQGTSILGNDVHITGDIDGTSIDCTSPCEFVLPQASGVVNWLADDSVVTESGTIEYSYNRFPDLTVTENPLVRGDNDWLVEYFTVTAEAYDDPHGIDSIQMRYNGGNWNNMDTVNINTDRVHYLEIKAFDTLGAAATENKTYKVDATDPIVNIILDEGAVGDNEWLVSDEIKIHTEASDATSGLASNSYQIDLFSEWMDGSAQTTIVDDGVYDVNVLAKDVAGNVLNETRQVALDHTKPTMNIQVEATEGDNGWYTSIAQVKHNAEDATSGLSGVMVSVNYGSYMTVAESGIAVSDGQHSLTFRATDLAGHVKESTKAVNVDSVMPQMTSVGIPEISGDNGWYNESIVIDPEGTDSNSGLADLEVSIDEGSWKDAPYTMADEGEHVISVRATDNAGNYNVQQRSVKLDKTLPTVSIQFDEGSDEDHILVKSNATDALSGLASIEYKIGSGLWYDESSAGVDVTIGKTITYRATDNAGNVLTTSPMTVNVGGAVYPTYTPYPTSTSSYSSSYTTTGTIIYRTPTPSSSSKTTTSSTSSTGIGDGDDGDDGEYADVKFTVLVYTDIDENGYFNDDEESEGVVVKVYDLEHTMLGEGATIEGEAIIVLRSFHLGDKVQVEVPYLNVSNRVIVDDIEVTVDMLLPPPKYPVYMP